MSTERSRWPVGLGITMTDLERMADNAAAAPDDALQAFAPPGAALKHIIPLAEETTAINPGRMVYPATGGDQGRVLLRRCTLVAAVADAVGFNIDLAATIQAESLSPAIASNSSGSTRYDLVYAILQWATGVTAARRIKDVDTDAISTDSIPLTEVPLVTLAVASSPTSEAAALALLPSDTSSAWNLPLAVVVVANGYVSGGAIAAGAGGGSTYILQRWVRGGVSQARIAERAASIHTGGVSGTVAPVEMSGRWGAHQVVNCGIVHSTSPQIHTLDTSIDWRLRRVKVRGGRALVGTNHPSPEAVTQAGGPLEFSGSGYTGSDGNAFLTIKLPAAGSTGGAVELQFTADSSGYLEVQFTGNPDPAGFGQDAYWLEIKHTARFEF